MDCTPVEEYASESAWAAEVPLDGFKNKRTKGGKGEDLGGGGGRERLCSKHIYEILKELIKNKHSKLLQCRRDWSNEVSTQGEYYFLEELFSSCLEVRNAHTICDSSSLSSA